MAPVSEAKKRRIKSGMMQIINALILHYQMEEAEMIDRYCTKKNISKNSFFREAVKEKIEREK